MITSIETIKNPTFNVPAAEFVCRALVSHTDSAYIAYSVRHDGLQGSGETEEEALSELSEKYKEFLSATCDASSELVEPDLSGVQGNYKSVIVNMSPTVQLSEEFLNAAENKLSPPSEWWDRDEPELF